uniref:Nucleic acid-binding protein n=1 Tax=Elaeophora elaphi TaxID=1147741 RepID=A0A0R3RI07_9BILA
MLTFSRATYKVCTFDEDGFLVTLVSRQLPCNVQCIVGIRDIISGRNRTRWFKGEKRNHRVRNVRQAVLVVGGVANSCFEDVQERWFCARCGCNLLLPPEFTVRTKNNSGGVSCPRLVLEYACNERKIVEASQIKP